MGEILISDDKVYDFIRKKIQALRNEHPETGKRITQQTLADALGIKRATLTNIELGNQRAPVNIIYRVCDYFGVSLEDVMPKVSEVKEEVDTPTVDVDEIKRLLPKGVLAAVEKASS